MSEVQTNLDPPDIESTVRQHAAYRATEEGAGDDLRGLRDEIRSLCLSSVADDREKTPVTFARATEVCLRPSGWAQRLVPVEVPTQRIAARIYEALARDPELQEELAELWRAMPCEFKLTAVNVYADLIFAALPRDLAYRLFECGWLWVENALNDRFDSKELEKERKHLREAKQLLTAVRKQLKEMKEREQPQRRAVPAL